MRPSSAIFVICALAVCLAGTSSVAEGAPAGGRPHLPTRALWIETSANLPHLRSREAIREMVGRARAAGIDTLIPEAKNAWGYVIYESEFAPHIRTSPIPRREYQAPSTWFPRDFDPLRVVIEEARAAGLRVHAAVNAFGEGLALPGLPRIGVLQSRPEWASVHLRSGPDGRPAFVPSIAAATIAFANPAHPEVHAYELAVLWEIVSRYDVDGIVLDRARYAGADADFSDLSRTLFTRYLGRPLGAWPDDVALPAEGGGIRPGPLHREWVAWRASVITSYVRAASRLARRTRPGVSVGMYVGAWDATVHDFGQNWMRADARPAFDAWSPALGRTSLLPELDYLMAGMYFRLVTRWDAFRLGRSGFATVLGGALRSRELTMGTPLVGSLWLALYHENRAAGEGAVRAASRLTDGVMFFDLSNVSAGDWWGVLDAR
jgi:uncharacterized lipoprotein YddW (UPF0748 family)